MLCQKNGLPRFLSLIGFWGGPVWLGVSMRLDLSLCQFLSERIVFLSSIVKMPLAWMSSAWFDALSWPCGNGFFFLLLDGKQKCLPCYNLMTSSVGQPGKRESELRWLEIMIVAIVNPSSLIKKKMHLVSFDYMNIARKKSFPTEFRRFFQCYRGE